MPFDVVIPTIGRPSLQQLLQSLSVAEGPLPRRVIVVDDRRDRSPAIDVSNIAEPLRSKIEVIAGKAAGPAAARNVGWRSSGAPWIAFLDDDVQVESDWLQRAEQDIASLDDRHAGSQGRVCVPLPANRPATDWERNVSGLQRSAWITADMIYRRGVLEQLGGFDERFPRAYREDADLALRTFDAGFTIDCGTRGIFHPVREANRWISVKLQAGNADDVLMLALHGPNWRRRANCAPGRWPYHVATVACFAAWAALTADFAWRRIAPGPRTFGEIATMTATSAIIPFAAVYHRVRGVFALPRALRRSA